MKKFKMWIRIEMDVEFLACVHGMSLVLLYGFFLWLSGQKNIPFAVIFEMVMLGYLIAWFQKLLFFRERVYKKLEHFIRSVLWSVGPFLMVFLAQILLSWFGSQPMWVRISFDVVTLLYFAMVCVFLQLFYRQDNRELNELLKEYQSRQEEKET